MKVSKNGEIKPDFKRISLIYIRITRNEIRNTHKPFIMKYQLLALSLVFFFRAFAQDTQNAATIAPSKTYAQFDHIALLVRDVKKSAAFYSGLFKMDSIPVPGGGDGKVYWFALNNNFQFHLVEGIQDSGPIRFNHVAFSVPSIPEFIKQLTRRHIVYYGSKGNFSVTYRPDKVHQIYFKDPDGYEVEVNDRPH
ncbi:MAG: VOC family protein [Bacteroidota bacterium]|nr:VOC family protein [Bacteroidota bacterium]MDP4250943.1 VOC family protein [Bacteroidota bacterium]